MSNTSNPDNATNGSISARSWIMSSLLAAVAGGCVLAFAPLPFDLSPEMAVVDQYSPKDLQDEAAMQIERVIWRNAVAILALTGVAWGLVHAACLAGMSKKGVIKLLLVGLIAGSIVGAGVGQLGLTMRSILNSDSAVARIQDPIYRDALFFLTLSMALSMIPTAIFLFGKAQSSIQQAVSIPIASGLGGTLVPIVASLFPGIATNLFPPNDPGIASAWFGMLGIMVAFVPGVVGSRSKASKSSSSSSNPASGTPAEPATKNSIQQESSEP